MNINGFPYLENPSDDDRLLVHVSSNNSYQNLKLGDIKNNAKLEFTNENITISDASLICDASTNSVTISIQIPDKPLILNLFRYGDYDVYLDFLGAKLNGESLTDTTTFVGKDTGSVQLVYVNEDFGWLDASKVITKLFTNNYADGLALLLQGSLTDSSGNNNHANALNVLPEMATGIDEQEVLRWNGTGTQELDIPVFLGSTTGATLYCVFTANNEGNYNLVRTTNIDDYWRFVNGNGYFGTFLNSRLSNYPSGMPSTGSHLVSIHASGNSYEVLLDNQSKGIVNAVYNPGNIFRIGTNDKPFKGDIALILVYPFFIDKSSSQHQTNILTIASKYPSLGIS